MPKNWAYIKIPSMSDSQLLMHKATYILELPFHRQAALFDKLYNNRQADDRPVVLDICKIPEIHIDDFRHSFARQTLRFPRSFHVRPKSFKAEVIFNIRHITSPAYILYFISSL